MKVLWICNVPIPQCAKAMGKNIPNICGWITGFANWLENNEEIDLTVCYPDLASKTMQKGMVGRIKFYTFSQPKMFGFLPAEDQLHPSKLMIEHINRLIIEVKPDILHVFGTEYPHSLVAIDAFGNPERTVVNIQGLTSIYWRHFNSGVPYDEEKRFTLSNLIRGNLHKQEHYFYKRGLFERDALKKARHVIGRTDWDKACTLEINPITKYHFCNETLRDSFYNGTWDYEKCEKHSIFMSQAATPIKGLHFMLQAMPEIIRVYPDTHLYIAGNNILLNDSIKKKIKISAFAKYIKRLIDTYDLEKYVTFTGKLSEEQMKQRYLLCNVFVSSSTVENESNSISEAKILSVPVVASYVGGVTNRINHGIDGFLYQHDAPYMLSYFVKQIFENPDKAVEMGKCAHNNAVLLHNKETNGKQLLRIYREIYNG